MQIKSIIFVYSLTLFSCALAIQDENDQEDNRENSYIDVHQHPRSGFSCEGKKVGEYYSDLSTNCQLYYVCLPNAQLKLAPISFACPNTTRFNQATRVCSTADQVYCNIAERSIDSKGNIPNVYLSADFDKTPWQINKKSAAKSLIVPLNLEPEYRRTERPRPSPRTVPKVETSVPKSDSPLHSSFALTFNQPQNARVVARTRAQQSTPTTNSRRGSALELLPNSLSQPSSSNRFRPSNNGNQNSRSRLPVYSNQSGPNSNGAKSTIATTPSTTTTTTTTTTLAPLITDVNSASKPNDPKSADYVYDYVEYDAPAANQPNSAPQSNNKPAALPAIPSLEEAQPNRPSSSNAGSLFSNHQQPPRISQPSSSSSSSNRPPQRNQLPQTNSLNYFNSNNPFSSNPFAHSSNPFASNPFSNSNSPSLIRQKRANPGEGVDKSDEFSCHDKLPGFAYADVSSKCTMYHICLPLSKNKYKDYTLFCEAGQAFNQFTSNCEPIDKFDCKLSKSFYLYNKQVNLDSYLKNRFRISKQMAEIKN